MVLYFTAAWCGPCKMFKPTVQAVSAETGVGISYVDVDQQPDIAQKYNISSVPTIIVENDYLISGSKDTLIKIWDIDARFCVENIVSHRGEVWCLAIKDDMLLTGCSDGLLRAWKLDTQILRCKLTR